MYECDRWYEYKGRDADLFENPPIYMKISKGLEYFIIALYPFETLQSPGVSLHGPFHQERFCDDLMTSFINN